MAGGGAPVATVFGKPRVARRVEYYPLDGSMAFTGPLIPPERRGTVRILAPDGIEVEAIEAGSVLGTQMGKPPDQASSTAHSHRRRGIGAGDLFPGRDQRLRDLSGGTIRHPRAGRRRAVPTGLQSCPEPLLRLQGSAYACPAPWQGNTLPAKVEAGERYGPSPAGSWRAALDLAGGQLRFGLVVARAGEKWEGSLCNGALCHPLSAVKVSGDSVTFEIADYAATITASTHGDSLAGTYRNVGNRGLAPFPFTPRAAGGRSHRGRTGSSGAGTPPFFRNWERARG